MKSDIPPVYRVAFHGASAARGSALSFVYCLGLGLPFLITGVLFQRAMSALRVVKRHYRLVMLLGGAMMVTVGILEVTGSWAHFVTWLQVQTGSTTLPL